MVSDDLRAMVEKRIAESEIAPVNLEFILSQIRATKDAAAEVKK
jgi:hypothetical protein